MPPAARTLEIDTQHGPARAHLHDVAEPRAALVLGHGAGGGIAAPDLVAATRAAVSARVSVVLVEQPYRLAGRRSPAPALQLDAAWLDVVASLRSGQLVDLPLVTGGRSAGARVACRTAAEAGAVAVLCLAFPLVPPGRREAVSRLPELDGVRVPVLVVQGERDPFGMPRGSKTRKVVRVAGDHSLKSDLATLGTAVRDWLVSLTWATTES